MSRKYIREIINQNFVYPNNQVSEYDLDNLVHDINDNCVSGTVTNVSATTISSTGITIQFSYTWSSNGAEKWVDNAGNLQLISVHTNDPSQLYLKPWRCVGNVSTATTGNTSYSGTTSVTFTPSNLGVTTFGTGVMYLEFRMIGHRCVVPICDSIVIGSIPTPTPTPTTTPTPTPTPCVDCYEYSFTATTSGLLEWLDCDGISSDAFVNSGDTYNITCLGGNGAREGSVTGSGTIVKGALCFGCTPTPTPTATPTPTPTPTATPTPTPTPTPGAGELYINARYINSPAILQYDINGGSPVTIGNIDSLTCQYYFTITGLTVSDIVNFYTSFTCGISVSVVDCPSSVSGCFDDHTFGGATTIYVCVDGSNCC